MALMLIGVAIYYTESMLRQGFTVRGVFIVLLAVCLAIHSLYVSITWFVSGEYHDDFLTLWIVLTVLFLILLKKRTSCPSRYPRAVALQRRSLHDTPRADVTTPSGVKKSKRRAAEKPPRSESPDLSPKKQLALPLSAGYKIFTHPP